jgi:probable biosynthetic protein (TIGR04099 family)
LALHLGLGSLSVSVRGASFDSVREHHWLAFASRLTRVSGTRFMSRHHLSIAGRAVGEIVMISTFVRRTRTGQNHSIARIEVGELLGLPVDTESASLADETAALRSNTWHAHAGFARETASVIDRFVIDPCPGQDFNGADFLYFASFQAFIDRAEWAYFRQRALVLTTRRRDIVYRCNIDVGERVVASLLQFQENPRGLDHWYRLTREQDGVTIAEAFTLRQAAPPRPPCGNRSW